MRLINRSKSSPLGRQACDAALASHFEKYGHYGRQYKTTTYTVLVKGIKVTVEVVSRATSYVATAMIGVRKLRNLPMQAEDEHAGHRAGCHEKREV